MSATMTPDPDPEGPSTVPAVQADDGSVTWGCRGYTGTILTVKRDRDGSITICTYHEDDTTSKAYAMHLSLAAVMHLQGFITGSGSIN